MSIFRCFWCGQVKCMTEHKDLNGLNLCTICHPIYSEKLKPKPMPRTFETADTYEKPDPVEKGLKKQPKRGKR